MLFVTSKLSCHHLADFFTVVYEMPRIWRLPLLFVKLSQRTRSNTRSLSPINKTLSNPMFWCLLRVNLSALWWVECSSLFLVGWRISSRNMRSEHKHGFYTSLIVDHNIDRLLGRRDMTSSPYFLHSVTPLYPSTCTHYLIDSGSTSLMNRHEPATITTKVHITSSFKWVITASLPEDILERTLPFGPSESIIMPTAKASRRALTTACCSIWRYIMM